MIHIPAICCVGAALWLICFSRYDSRHEILVQIAAINTNAIRAVVWVLLAMLYEWFIFH